MKRPFGVTGLVYLVTLAVVFYYNSTLTVLLLAGGAVLAVLAGVFDRILRRKRAGFAPIAAGISMLAAIASIFLYWNIKVQPILDSYADKTVMAEGYVTDDIRYKNRYTTYIFQSESMNQEACDAKISLTVPNRFGFEPFDKLRVKLAPQQSSYPYMMSKGVFLYAFVDNAADIQPTGEKHETPYAWIVSVREWLKEVLEARTDAESADVAKAVLLGDKQALSADIYRAFTATGTSYLIVVSGMHLSIATLLLRVLLKRGVPPWLQFILTVLFVLFFVALTGFTPSVIRAGVMLSIASLANVVLRDPDGVNSLGVAAWVMTAANPLAVGDMGLLLSFSATFGILVWADPICRFCLRRLPLKKKKRKGTQYTLGMRAGYMLRRSVRGIVAFVSVSLAATLWVIPLTILSFEKVTPLTVLISLAAYPLTCIVLLAAVLLFVFQWLPPVAFVLEKALSWAAHALIHVEAFSAQLPFATIAADKMFWKIWVGVTAALVILGYLIHRRRHYVFYAAVISILTLTIGGSLTYLYADNAAALTITRYGSAYSVAVEKGSNLSFLSCGGSQKDTGAVLSAAERCGQVDMVIMTSRTKSNTGCLAALAERYDIENVISVEGKNGEKPVGAEDALTIRDGTRFTVMLNSEVSVEIVTVKKKTYQYVTIRGKTLLIVPRWAKLRNLPEELLHADTALLEGEATDAELLDVQTMLTVREGKNNAQLIPEGVSIEIQ